jgi:hypothetical protein
VIWWHADRNGQSQTTSFGSGTCSFVAVCPVAGGGHDAPKPHPAALFLLPTIANSN